MKNKILVSFLLLLLLLSLSINVLLFVNINSQNEKIDNLRSENDSLYKFKIESLSLKSKEQKLNDCLDEVTSRVSQPLPNMTFEGMKFFAGMIENEKDICIKRYK